MPLPACPAPTTGTQRFLAAFARWAAPALSVPDSLALAGAYLDRQGKAP